MTQVAVLKKLAGDAGMVLGLRMAAAVLGYSVTILLSQNLTGINYGHYATMMTWVTFASVLCRFGTNISVVRFLGEYRVNERSELVRGLVATVGRLLLSLTSACAIIATPADPVCLPGRKR